MAAPAPAASAASSASSADSSAIGAGALAPAPAASASAPAAAASAPASTSATALAVAAPTAVVVAAPAAAGSKRPAGRLGAGAASSSAPKRGCLLGPGGCLPAGMHPPCSGEHARLVSAVMRAAQRRSLVQADELVTLSGTGSQWPELVRVPSGCCLAEFSFARVDRDVADLCKSAVSQSAVLSWILARVGLEPTAVSVSDVSCQLIGSWPR